MDIHISRRDDKLARIEDLQVEKFEALEDLWENTETARDLWYEIKSAFILLQKLRSELK